LCEHGFLWLANFNVDWATQETLIDDKAFTFLVCLLHYNLSMAHTIWFLGNNCTGAHHDIPSIVVSLRSRGIAEALITHYSCSCIGDRVITHPSKEK
jgi:hypothetical protein